MIEKMIIKASSQTLKFYLFLGFLFKAEALYTIYMCWLQDIIVNNKLDNLHIYKYLPYIWLFKPILCLINDRLNDDSNNKKLKFFTFNGRILNLNLIILITSEIIMIITSILLYISYYFNSNINPITSVIFMIFLVYTSAYAELLFCKYVKSKSESEYIKYVSIRLILSSIYGFSTVVCVVTPLLLNSSRFANLLNMNILFPIFVFSNGLSILWMIYKGVYIPGDTLEHVSIFKDIVEQTSPNTEALNTSTNDDNHKFSFDCIIALIILLLMALNFKSQILKSKHQFNQLYNYLLFLYSQLAKITVSSLILTHINFKRVVKLSMGIFGFALLMIYPLRPLLLRLLMRIENGGFLMMILMTLITSGSQQMLLTYSFSICLLNMLKGYESSVISLPTFVMHLSVIPLKSLVELDYTLKAAFDIVIISVHSYCYCILFDINHKNLLQRYKNLRSKFIKSTDKVDGDKWDNSFSYNTNISTDNNEPKSPWELQSDFSDDSDGL